MHICSGSPDPLLDTPLPSLYKLNKLKRLPHIEFIELNLHLFKSLCATSYIHLISVHCTAVYARARNLRVFVERNSRVSFLRSLHFFEFWIYEERQHIEIIYKTAWLHLWNRVFYTGFVVLPSLQFRALVVL